MKNENEIARLIIELKAARDRIRELEAEKSHWSASWLTKAVGQANAETDSPAVPKFKVGDKVIRDIGGTATTAYCVGTICSANKDENGYWGVRCGTFRYRTLEHRLTPYPYIADPDSWELDGLEKQLPKMGDAILTARGLPSYVMDNRRMTAKRWKLRMTLARKIADNLPCIPDRSHNASRYARKFIAPVIREHEKES